MTQTQNPTAEIVTDAQLDQWKTGGSIGHRKAVPTLLPLTPEQRWTAIQEANLRMAYTAGWNFSGAVYQAVKDIENGQTPCLDRYRDEMAARKA